MAVFDDDVTDICPENVDLTTKLYSVEIFPAVGSTSVKLITPITLVMKTDS